MIAYEIDGENTDRSDASVLCGLDFIDPMIPPQAVSHSIESHKPENGSDINYFNYTSKQTGCQ